MGPGSIAGTARVSSWVEIDPSEVSGGAGWEGNLVKDARDAARSAAAVTTASLRMMIPLSKPEAGRAGMSVPSSAREHRTSTGSRHLPFEVSLTEDRPD